jgi:hypothetical protein
MQNRHGGSAIQNGFTLIEIIGSVSAFTIAFLAGTSAFAILYKHQMVSTQRSISASAAMLIMDWHARKEVSDLGSGLIANTADLLWKIPGRENVLSNECVRFVGGDADDDDVVFVFRSTSVPDLTDQQIKIYGNMIITVSKRSSAEIASPDGNRVVFWREMTMWSGSVQRFLNNEHSNVHFLSRYLLPELK